jgi:hypothetical protein
MAGASAIYAHCSCSFVEGHIVIKEHNVTFPSKHELCFALVPPYVVDQILGNKNYLKCLYLRFVGYTFISHILHLSVSHSNLYGPLYFGGQRTCLYILSRYSVWYLSSVVQCRTLSTARTAGLVLYVVLPRPFVDIKGNCSGKRQSA